MGHEWQRVIQHNSGNYRSSKQTNISPIKNPCELGLIMLFLTLNSISVSRMKFALLSVFTICIVFQLLAQELPRAVDPRMYEIVQAASAERLEQDVQKLVNFGTRHTLSDTVSQTRGIGAARRWIKSEFDQISKSCDNCLEVFYLDDLVPPGQHLHQCRDPYFWHSRLATVVLFPHGL